MMKKKIALIIERSEENYLYGRVQYEDNLLIENALSLSELKDKMKTLLKEWHGLSPEKIEFDLQYDLEGLFNEKKILNASVIAERAGINKSLMRQYAAGLKYPSLERAKDIERVIHEIAKEMLVIKISNRSKRRMRQV